MNTTKIEHFAADDAPILGARKVWWLIDGAWEHKGWLMPPLKQDVCPTPTECYLNAGCIHGCVDE